MNKIISLRITEMDCSEEVNIIKKVLQASFDIKNDLAFDVINGKLDIDVSNSEIDNEEKLIELIAKTGMKAVVWVENAENQKLSFWEKNNRSIMCLASVFFILAGYLVHAWNHGFLDALSAVDPENHNFPTAAIALFVLSIITGGRYIFPKALYSAKLRTPDMNLLMTIAVIGAVILGEWFEAAAVSVLFSFALLLESWSTGKARNAIEALIDLTPKTAFVMSCCGNFEEELISEIKIGSRILVKPGDKIPLDGTIRSGSSYIDQSPITGESTPVWKTVEDDVYAGTINNDGSLEIISTKAPEDTTLAQVIKLINEARTKRSVSERWVDSFSRKYTPVMMAIALSFAVLPPILFDGDFVKWFYEALVILVIACPCALVISTPVSIVSSLACAAKNGILVKGGTFIEIMAKIKVFSFDKTGTLTKGKPKVYDVHPLNDHSKEDIIRIAASLETKSSHPLSTAIIEHAKSEKIAYTHPESLTVLPGKGAEGKLDDSNYWIGSHRLMHEKGKETAEFHKIALQLESEGKSVIALGEDHHVCGIIGIADEIREDSKTFVQDLRKLGIKHLTIITGDNEGTAKSIGDQVDIDEIYSDQLPADKVNVVKSLVEKFGTTAMLGDGVNDAPAMAAASIGIAMGGIGTDTAIETADITLMDDNIAKLPWMVKHSRKTVNIIKQNITFALGLKAIFIVLAVTGLATLWMAIAADMGASLLVIFNSLRLLRTNKL